VAPTSTARHTFLAEATLASESQFKLLAQRRFGPFFATQFLGAFNDNIFKNALIVLIAFQVVGEQSPEVLINVSAGLFILPFFLFSATFGQLADKLDKARLIRITKLLEVLIMLGAAVAFMIDSLGMLIALLFLMGVQSALFGPVKYSILPQQLNDAELIGGNGLVESGTFLAILLGTLAGGLLIGTDQGATWVGLTLVIVALVGFATSRWVPATTPTVPNLKVNLNPLTETWRIYKFLRGNRTVFLSILGISWFWLLGALYLAQLPLYAKDVLGANEQVVTLLLVLFSVGIGIGSLLCEKLSGGKVELGLVPFGSIGLTIFGIDLFFTPNMASGALLVGAGEFIQQPGALRLLLDILGIGVFGGFYIVPLYALIQQRSAPSHRSRVIAGNNIMNALFMVGGAIFAVIALGAGLEIDALFLTLAVMNAAVAAYIYTLVPEFTMRFMTWILIHVLYRIDKEGLQQIPDEGPAVLVCNHVSFVDAMVIGGCCPRPVRFVMYYKIFNAPILNFIFRTARAIPIAGSKEDPQLLEQAYTDIGNALEAGELVCVFPEGQITQDGALNDFRPGVERILARNPVPVVPLALRGLWGSFFSRRYGTAMMSIPRRFLSRIALVAGHPIAAENASASELQQVVAELRGEQL
jgi:1-acyl-sn-glycerol-3-phosphate acyltransferase